MGAKSKNGLESSPLSYNHVSELEAKPLLTDCPRCGATDSLQYGIKEETLSDESEIVVEVEGLICLQCEEIFMSPKECARFLNKRATYEGTLTRFFVDGSNKIVEATVH